MVASLDLNPIFGAGARVTLDTASEVAEPEPGNAHTQALSTQSVPTNMIVR